MKIGYDRTIRIALRQKDVYISSSSVLLVVVVSRVEALHLFHNGI